MKKKIEKSVLSAMFCALIFLMTWILIPAPTIGNINLGDCMIIFAAYILGPYAIFAGAIGAALCDLLSGYVIYVPGTFVIKALMVVVFLFMRKLILKRGRLVYLILAGALSEIVMIVGYLIYEALVLGYGVGAFANVPFNAVQGGVNLVAVAILYTATKNIKFVKSIIQNEHNK